MSTLPKGCTCTVTLPDLYCPLHKAAPDLLAALKEIMPWIGKALADDAFAWCVNPSRAHKAADHGCAAIAKAEGVLGCPTP